MKILAIAVLTKIVLKNRLAGLEYLLQRLLVPPPLWCRSAVLVEDLYTQTALLNIKRRVSIVTDRPGQNTGFSVGGFES